MPIYELGREDQRIKLAQQQQMIDAMNEFSNFMQKRKELNMEERLLPAKEMYYKSQPAVLAAQLGYDPSQFLFGQSKTPFQQQLQQPQQTQQAPIAGVKQASQNNQYSALSPFLDDLESKYDDFYKQAGSDKNRQKKVDDFVFGQIKEKFKDVPFFDKIEQEYLAGNINSKDLIEFIDSLLSNT